MHTGQRQVIAEKISSTVRVLELLEFEYEVSGPRNERSKENKSPRVVRVNVGEKHRLWVGNSASGKTWAFEPNGKPIPQIKSIEDLYDYLKEKRGKMKKSSIKTVR
jgi:hypothetical protein